MALGDDRGEARAFLRLLDRETGEALTCFTATGRTLTFGRSNATDIRLHVPTVSKGASALRPWLR